VNRLCLEFVILSNPWDVMVYLLETEFKLLAFFTNSGFSEGLVMVNDFGS
jgi:hypothetical protein